MKENKKKSSDPRAYLISLQNELYSVILVLSSNKDKTSLAGAFIKPLHITHAYWELGPIPRNFLNTEYPSSLLINFQSMKKKQYYTGGGNKEIGNGREKIKNKVRG